MALPDPAPAVAALLQDPAVCRLLAILPQARLVGGCVRDALAGRPSADIDLATPDRPEQVAAALANSGIRVIPTGLAHGTVTALAEARPFEITTLRRDAQTDGRHAVVAWTDDWREDAARRDFTINAMSLSAEGTVHDYFGGAADLAVGRVRFVGDAAARVAEDYLRVLRFFRFYARYAAGAPDREAVAAVAAGVPGLARLSAERVWSELKRILQAPAPDAALRLMAQTGVLQATLPNAQLASLDRLPPDPVLRLAALLPPAERETVAERLKLSGADAALLLALDGPPPPADAAGLRRALATTPPGVLLARSWLAGQPQSQRDAIAATPPPVFPLEGRDALALGLPPGPAIGALLRQVRAWWLAGGCTASAAACRAELARLAAA